MTPVVLPEIRTQAASALSHVNPSDKVNAVLGLAVDGPVDPAAVLTPRVGRPDKPRLVHPREVPTRGVGDDTGRGMLLHALAHIEFNAINLALDLVVRFAGQPVDFYREWLQVAREEAYHHTLLCERLADYGVAYGDYPAHDGLWQMAEKTAGSLMARLALVPRLLEARGLDVSPAIRDKLKSAGDLHSAQVLDIILRDEIGHVAIGNRWFNVQCQHQGLEPVAAFEQLLAQYSAPAPRSPFNYPARRDAGFSELELAWLHQIELAQQ
ncbi:ferritin-like domain-containing protein [Limnobacter humi]|uniref:Ferritin-like domain-containing protein n=1 Tax=Limnobacter humi TaxID=1778671 RepID=A0ABT1WI65_9BURK|nr:ferritin-like domain-containing protein [Limnobacter humi]MCQ8897207.1 ferritin-like domain-containing protein [Limnobacter humi]